MDYLRLFSVIHCKIVIKKIKMKHTVANHCMHAWYGRKDEIYQFKILNNYMTMVNTNDLHHFQMFSLRLFYYF